MQLISPVTIFLELTNKCNLQCVHCYNSSSLKGNSEWEYKDLVSILDEAEKQGVVSISISGGEPLIYNKLWTLLEYICNNTKLKITINTNGILLSDGICKRLYSLGVSDIQISLDGLQNAHDFIRGIGNFNKSVNGIRNAIKNRIRVRIGFTANAKNYNELESLIKFAKEEGVSSTAVYRYVPSSNRDKDKQLALNAKNLLELSYNLLEYDEQLSTKTFKIYYDSLTFFSFLIDKKNISKYLCLAGLGQLNLSFNKEVVLCPHYRVTLRNLHDKSLKALWSTQQKLRIKLEAIPSECQACKYHMICKGGCKGIISATYGGKISKKDPACFIDFL